MASAKISVRPLISSAQQLKSTPTRFLTSRSNQWTQSNNGASSAIRFVPNLHNPLHPPLHFFISLRRPLVLPCPPLSFLLRPRPPRFRHSLRLMTTPQAASDSTESSSSSTKTVRMLIKGRVQGVFYRDWTMSNATELGLKGWVRNRRDGSVETLLSGKPDAVKEMEQRCRRGPPSALVTGLDVFPSDEDAGNGFVRKQTSDNPEGFSIAYPSPDSTIAQIAAVFAKLRPVRITMKVSLLITAIAAAAAGDLGPYL